MWDVRLVTICDYDVLPPSSQDVLFVRSGSSLFRNFSFTLNLRPLFLYSEKNFQYERCPLTFSRTFRICLSSTVPPLPRGKPWSTELKSVFDVSETSGNSSAQYPRLDVRPTRDCCPTSYSTCFLRDLVLPVFHPVGDCIPSVIFPLFRRTLCLFSVSVSCPRTCPGLLCLNSPCGHTDRTHGPPR